MPNKKISKPLIAVIAFIGIGILFFIFSSINKNPANSFNSQYTAEVYYSTTCGCCINYIGYLRSNGFKVKAIAVDSPDLIKDQHKIPSNMRSCHTTKIGQYFIEGHIPVEAIISLLEKTPALDGIAMPNMPSGSPGMPGKKTSPFMIYGIKDGKADGIFTQI